MNFATVKYLYVPMMLKSLSFFDVEPMHTFGIEWIVVGFSNMNHQHREPSSVNCSSVAFLQYTSGSTGNPKGCLLLFIHDSLLFYFYKLSILYLARRLYYTLES